MASITKNGWKRKGSYTGFLYILPWLVGFIVFQLYPFLYSFILSFTDAGPIGAYHWIGLNNYSQLFRDADFYKSFSVTFAYVLIAVPVKLIFALLVAMMLSAKLRFIHVYRTVYYLPSILGGSVAVSVLWRVLFLRDGMINAFLGKVHVPPVDWLGSPDIALYTVSMLAVWQFGSSMVIFLAGIKQIPQDLYEASTVDGASKIRKFMTITIPMLTPLIFFNLVMQTVGAFQDFTGAFVITGGGPLKSTYLYALKLYEEAFRFYNIGYASALSWVLFVVLMILTALIFESSRTWIHYEDGGDK